MLGVTRYKAQAYPPPGFPRFSGASAETPAFKRLQEKTNPMLQGMLDRKKGSNEILQQRAAAFQSASTPAALIAAPTPAAPTPVALAAPTPTALTAPAVEHFQLFEDAESGHDASDEAPTQSEEEQSKGEQSEGEQNTFQPTASGPSAGSALASGASAVGSALASGASAVGGALTSGAYNTVSSGLGYATTGSHILLDAGMHAGIRAENAFERHARAVRQAVRHKLTQGVNTITPQLAVGAGMVGSIAQAGVVGIAQGLGHGVGSIVHGGAHVTTQHILPGAASLASAAYEHGLPAAHDALTGLSYRGSDLFHALLEGIKSLPAIPSLEMQHTTHVGDTLAMSHSQYAPIRNKQRSSSPSTASASVPARAHATPFVPYEPVHTTGPDVVSYETADQWRAHSKGKAFLGEQLKLRPQFISVEKSFARRGDAVSQNGSRNSTATKFKGLTRDDMIQLLLFLDGKH